MSIDTPNSQIQEKPKPWATNADIQKTLENDLSSKKLTKVNNVLLILDFPDNQEEVSKNILLEQDNKTLEKLATKSKNEIVTFLIEEKRKEKVKENNTQNETYNEDNKKFQAIKSILPNWVFDDAKPEFKNLRSNLSKFEDLQLWDDADINTKINKQKAEILEAIIEELKNPKVLKSVVKDLGWANKNNPRYAEFRNALISIDNSFIAHFDDLEILEIWTAFSLDEVVEWIEWASGGMVDIDLKSSDSVSKMSLIWSNYSFDEEIDKKEIDEIIWDSKEELEDLKNSFATLGEFEKSFSDFRNGLRKVWWKENFKENLKRLIQNFWKEVFTSFNNVYKNVDIDPAMQIKESDISNFAINDGMYLEPQFKNVFSKIEHHQEEISKNENSIVLKYKSELKELLQRTAENKEKQLETLKFLRASGFDELPKWISNRIIKEVQGNVLTIPWLDLARNNIDLKNGNFWESWAFSGKENGLNIESKTNLVKLVNKIISWDVNEPLSVEAIANGITVADPRFVKSALMGATIKWRVSWNYGKVVENLKSENN